MATIPNDLLDRIRRLERQVRELAGRSQTRPPLNEISDGAVRIVDGGQLVVAPPGKDYATFTVGEWPDGSFGMVVRRFDGTYALTVEGEREDRGTVRMWSRDLAAPDRILVMDDRHSDRFLGRPWMPVPLHPTADQSTTSDGWRYAWVGKAPAHNAVAVLRASTYAEAGAEVRLVMLPAEGEPVVVTSRKVPARAWTTVQGVQPLHGVDFLDEVGWQIQHRSLKRGQPVETRLFTAYTRNTFTADEAPDLPLGRNPDTGKTPDPRLDVEANEDQGEHQLDRAPAPTDHN
ncbi:hypothetical protein HUT18_18275 [Streptomyces sp. NA04227]|uniref:hypothetical protein n=1 Tax=Streptomyces sp. NA04227 TaxID=2742136 RepID=UPI0015911412|nr:hypothetical protein [Streptomyces sp. NA04227]QKW08035.1 hypothetical protein HUT18_18275 [Streptomyces sp. NA04227]